MRHEFVWLFVRLQQYSRRGEGEKEVAQERASLKSTDYMTLRETVDYFVAKGNEGISY